MLFRLAARHETAKKMLIDQGRPKELVDAMPHVQVGLLVALAAIRRGIRRIAEMAKSSVLGSATRTGQVGETDQRNARR